MEKKFRIGSSDIAAIIGANPYKTPVDLWLVKTGRKEKFAGNAATNRGELLEPVVAQYFSQETGIVVEQQTGNYTFENCIARTDYVYHLGNGLGILECKTTSMKVNAATIPAMWYIQAQFQAAVMNRASETGQIVNEVSIAFLSGDLNFEYEVYDVDVDYGDKLLFIAEKFIREHLMTDTPPQPETAQDVISLYPKDSGNEIDIDEQPGLKTAYKQLQAAHKQYKTAELEYDDAKQALQELMKDASALTFEGRKVITWKNDKDGMTFDQKAFKAQNPKLYEKFMVVKPGARKFLVK